MNVEHRTSNIEHRSSDRKYDLEERLLAYSVLIIRLAEGLPETRSGNHLGGHLLRSGTSPLFNHGEAQAAESARDFVHKLSVCLKELRESKRALKLVRAVPLAKGELVDALLKETEELIRIFVASIKTAKAKAVDDNTGAYNAD